MLWHLSQTITSIDLHCKQVPFFFPFLLEHVFFMYHCLLEYHRHIWFEKLGCDQRVTVSPLLLRLTHILKRPFNPEEKKQLCSSTSVFTSDFYPFFFSTDPPQLPPSSVWTSCCWNLCLNCVFVSEWCFPFRATEGERTARTKMLIKCSVADKDTWECMH